MIQKKNDRVILRLMKETKPIAKWLLLGAILSILSVFAAVLSPEIMGSVVEKLVVFWESGGDGTVVEAIKAPLLTLLAVYAIYAIADYLNMLLMNNVVSRYYSCGMRIKLSDKIKRLPVKYLDQTPVGDIIRRMTDDVSEMGGYVHQIFDTAIKGALQILLISAAMLIKDCRLAIFVILITPLSLLLSSKIAGLCEKYFDEMFEKSGKLTELVEESFTNFANTKAYNMENYTQLRHENINSVVRDATAKADFTGAIVQPIIRLSNAVAYILINLIGGYLAVMQGVSVGAVVTVILYARLFATPLE